MFKKRKKERGKRNQVWEGQISKRRRRGSESESESESERQDGDDIEDKREKTKQHVKSVAIRRGSSEFRERGGEREREMMLITPPSTAHSEPTKALFV